MTSKTQLTRQIKALGVDEVRRGLDANPELLSYRDPRGRGWLHLCASIEAGPANAKASIDLARDLLERGLPINAAAFAEDTWQATPLWYAVARGRNLQLARFLLQSGATPEHCLWAAAFNEDLPIIALLLEFNAPLEAIAEDETAFLHAVKWSKFIAAKALLEAGSNPDFQDSKGMTALHYMLKKQSPKMHFSMLAAHNARGDISNQHGQTAGDIMRKKRDPDYGILADKFG